MEEFTTSQLKAMLMKNSGASVAEVRAALRELKRRGEPTPPPSQVIGGRVDKESRLKKAQMMMGGMANGKKHMYSAGGDVTDNLPNKGLKKLAKTEKGRAAVRNMGFDV